MSCARAFRFPASTTRIRPRTAFAPLFALDLIAKDLALALELAADHGLDAPVADAALDAYRAAQRDGLGALDYSAVYRRGGGPEASD